MFLFLNGYICLLFPHAKIWHKAFLNAGHLTHLGIWLLFDRLMIIWKFHLSDKIKKIFFLSIAVSALQYGLHYLDFNEMPGEKAKWELHKDAAFCFDQILEAALDKAPAVWPLTSHPQNHLNKISKTCWRSKHKWLSPNDSYTCTH